MIVADFRIQITDNLYFEIDKISIFAANLTANYK